MQLVQETICPDITDEGVGLAPIGHKVTVTTVEETDINLATTVTISTNTSINTIKEKIEEVLSEYLLNLRKTWEDAESIIVRISQIEARILDIDGVIDVTNTTINGTTSNLELPVTEIPVLGEVIVE